MNGISEGNLDRINGIYRITEAASRRNRKDIRIENSRSIFPFMSFMFLLSASLPHPVNPVNPV
jgi:hypothetical protein